MNSSDIQLTSQLDNEPADRMNNLGFEDSESITQSKFVAPKVGEWLAVFALLIGALLFNASNYNDYPTVWADEVLWSEPAINLVKTGHFTTSVWQFQRAGSFWAAQSPLYCFGLAAWMKVAGTDLQAARSFNLALITVAVFLAWILSWRSKLISRPGLRILLPVLLLTGYGTSFAYRCSRPDIAGMVCLLALALAFFVKSGPLRLGTLFVSAAAAPWIGIQLGLFTAIACALAFLFFPSWRTWKDCLVVAGGMFMGVVSMLAFYQAHGVLGDLMSSVSQAANEQQHWGGVDSYWTSIPRRIRQSLSAFTNDFSVMCLMAGSILLLLSRWRVRKSRSETLDRDVLFALAVAIIIPFAFSFTAHFAFYYQYMVYVPVVLAFLALWNRTIGPLSHPPHWKAAACMAIAAGACILGLPLRLLITRSFCDVVPRQEYSSLIHSSVKPDDVIFADYPAFFECKTVAHRVYSPMYSRHFVNLSPTAQDFTAKEKEEVTVLAVPASKFAEMKEYWGGEWTAMTQPFGDSILDNSFREVPFFGKRLQSYLSNPQTARTPLQLFRRVAGPPVSTSTGTPGTLADDSEFTPP